MKQDQPAMAAMILPGTMSIAPEIGSNGTDASIEKKDSIGECVESPATEMKESTSGTTSSSITAITPQSSTHPPLPPSTSSFQLSEQLRLRKKSQNILNRSDSTGSSSGRKFLVPTLSDPQAIRSEKYMQKKKAGSFIGTSNTHSSQMSSTSTPTRSNTGTLRSQLHSSNNNSAAMTTSAATAATTATGIGSCSGGGLSIISSGVCLSTVNTISTGNSSAIGSSKHLLQPFASDTMIQPHHTHLSNTIALSVSGLDSQFSSIECAGSVASSASTTGIIGNITDASHGHHEIGESGQSDEYTIGDMSEVHTDLSHLHAHQNELISTTATPSTTSHTPMAYAIDPNTLDACVSAAQTATTNTGIITNSFPTAINLSQMCATGGGGAGGSSSTGSNVAAGSSSKVHSTMAGVNNSQPNVVFEVHDWWTDQVITHHSSDDDEEYID